jgi:hypothetical protein
MCDDSVQFVYFLLCCVFIKWAIIDTGRISPTSVTVVNGGKSAREFDNPLTKAIFTTRSRHWKSV